MAVKKQTFAKGVLIIMVSQVFIKLLGFIYRIILTNIKGFQDVGNSYYSSGYKVYTFILAIATTGIPSAISKLVSEKIAVGDKRGAHRIFKISLKLFTVVGIILSLVLLVGSNFIANNILNNPGVKGVMKTLAPAIFFVAIASVYRGYFVGMQNMTAHSTAQILEQIVNSILSVVFVIMLIGNSPEIMAIGSTLATAVSTFVALLYLYLYYRKNKSEIWKQIKDSKIYPSETTKTLIRKITKYVIPLSITSIVYSLSGIIDLISVIDGLKKFGYSIVEANEKFGIILGKVDILVSIPHTFNSALVIPLIPIITEYMVKGEKAQAVSKINSCMKISSIISFPCAAGLTLLAVPIFNTIYPGATNGAYLLQIEIWAVLFSLTAQTAYASLNGIGRLYVPGISVLIGGIIKYILNVNFVPIYGEVVVSITTIVYHLIACIISMTILYKDLREKPDYKNILFRPLLATIFMSLVVLISQKIFLNMNLSSSISMVICIMLGIVTYAYSLFKLKMFTKQDIIKLPYGNKLCKLGLKSNKN